MMNIFDLLGCAIKPTRTMEDGEQIDMIKGVSTILIF